MEDEFSQESPASTRAGAALASATATSDEFPRSLAVVLAAEMRSAAVGFSLESTNGQRSGAARESGTWTIDEPSLESLTSIGPGAAVKSATAASDEFPRSLAVVLASEVR